MADILIRNMKITDRPITLVLYPNGDVDHITQDKRYETIAKAIVIPPHGRLIDADKEVKDWKITKTILEECEDKKSFSYRKACIVIDALNEAPTVLEASNGTDN